MKTLETLEKIEQIRKHLWYERLIFFPIKLSLAGVAFYSFEHGLFIVVAYLLFIVGEVRARQHVNAQELNATIQQTHQSLVEYITSNNSAISERIEKIKELELRVDDLEIRIED